MKAKDINDCDECPLYKNDCVGGWGKRDRGRALRKQREEKKR